MSANVVRFITKNHRTLRRLRDGEREDSNQSLGVSEPIDFISAQRQRQGTEPRCRHFLTASGDAPNDMAVARMTSQFNSMTAHDGYDLSHSQGTSWDDASRKRIIKNVRMPISSQPAAVYTKSILDRTRAARMNRGWSQAEMAQFLGIGVEVYKKYETRTPLPHRFMDLFCTLTGISIEFLVTGRVLTKPNRTALARHKRRANSV